MHACIQKCLKFSVNFPVLRVKYWRGKRGHVRVLCLTAREPFWKRRSSFVIKSNRFFVYILGGSTLEKRVHDKVSTNKANKTENGENWTDMERKRRLCRSPAMMSSRDLFGNFMRNEKRKFVNRVHARIKDARGGAYTNKNPLKDQCRHSLKQSISGVHWHSVVALRVLTNCPALSVLPVFSLCYRLSVGSPAGIVSKLVRTARRYRTWKTWLSLLLSPC